MAILLKQGLDDYFITEYVMQRMEPAFGRLYLPVPDRRLEVMRFVRSSDARSYRVPAGILPPTTAPTVENAYANHPLVNGKELETTLTVSDVSKGDTISFKINEGLADEIAVSVVAGASDTNTTVAAAILADITGAAAYAMATYTASASGAVVTILANDRNGNNQVPFVLGTITATGCTVTKEIVNAASGMIAGQKVRFAYQFYSSVRGVWSELSPWSALHTVGTRQFRISGFEAPRDGRWNDGNPNAYDIDQIWLYAAYETSGGFCDVGSMVKAKHNAANPINWETTVMYFDMPEDMLVMGTPMPAVGIHEIPPAVKTVCKHGNRVLMAGQLQRRFGSVLFPAHENSETAWPQPHKATVYVTPHQKYRVDEDNDQLTRALCRITGCFIDDSYIGYDLYCNDRYIGTVMDIVRSTRPTNTAIIPFENNPPYECSFYLWNDWLGEDLTGGTTDFYFVGHPNRIWIGGYDAEQSPNGTPFVRPETIHPLAYVDLAPGQDNAIQDIVNAGDNLSYVICKRGVWLLTGGEKPGPMPLVQIRQIEGLIGEIAPRSAVVLSNGMLQFISKDGVYQANTGGIRKVTTGVQRLFAGAHDRTGATNEFSISATMLDDIASAIVRGEDSPMVVHAGFTRGSAGDARSAWMTQDLTNGTFFEHDRVEVTSNILGDTYGIFPPICGDDLGRVKEILCPDVFTDLTRDSDAPATLPAYTCRWQSVPFSLDGLDHRPTVVRLVLRARSTFTLYVYFRAGYSLATPIPASYAAVAGEESGPDGWRDETVTGVFYTERITVKEGDENYFVSLPQAMGKEFIVELRWTSNAGPLEINTVELWGE